MDNNSGKFSSTISIPSTIDSSSVIGKDKIRESKIRQHRGSKLQTLRMRLLGQEDDHIVQVPVVEPLKPMPYVRRFTVSVSLKKSRLLRFLFFCFN